MCIFNIKKLKIKLTSYTGYKYVIVINGKYYSPTTGIKYKVGKVPVLTSNMKLEIHGGNSINQYLSPTSKYNSKNYNGNTSVFKSLKKCEDECKGKDIIKMTISGNLKKAKHSLTLGNIKDIHKSRISNVIIGNHIDKIELIKTK